MEKYRLFFEIPWLPAALNKKLSGHWRDRHRENNAWDVYIHTLVMGKKPKSPLKRASIRLVRHAYRSLDFDGLVGSLKPVIDSLVTAGVLADDSWNVLGAWSVDQKFRAKKLGPLLEIEIVEIPET